MEPNLRDEPLIIEIDGEIMLTPASPRFGFADEAFILRKFRDSSQTLADTLASLIRSLYQAEISRRVFVRQSMRALQQAYYTVYALAALSVDSFHVATPQDLMAVQDELLGERRFLQSFARDLSTDVLGMAPDVRARLYLEALRGVFELGRIQALPAGPYDWISGDADHCFACTVASENGPYKRDAISRLSLPVVPGIPGSGEVCQGLTRCGCTLRLRGFPANEALQLQLRDILHSVRLEV